jgi:glycosyltransferase involved in cell wall biosynthesis
MELGVDVRGLSPRWQGGVNEYTIALLKELLRYDDVRGHLVGSVFGAAHRAYITSLFPPGERLSLPGMYLPSKLLNLSLLTLHAPKLDSCLGREPDVFWMPNLNIGSLHRRIPSVLTIHDVTFELYPEFFSQKILAWHKSVRPKQQARDATHILTVSHSTKQDLMDLYGLHAEEISVTYPGLSPIFHNPNIDIKYIRAKYHLPSQFILYLGTIEPRKNLSALIQSFEYLAAEYPELHLVLAGQNGWLYEHIHAQTSKSPFANRVHYTGFVAHEDKPSLYAAAELFVYPSFYEGFGFPPLEAMACGTPVITSNLSSFPEVINNAGLMISPYNAHELTWAIRELYTDENLRSHFQQIGPSHARQFTWETTARETREIFEQVQ